MGPKEKYARAVEPSAATRWSPLDNLCLQKCVDLRRHCSRAVVVAADDVAAALAAVVGERLSLAARPRHAEKSVKPAGKNNGLRYNQPS